MEEARAEGGRYGAAAAALYAGIVLLMLVQQPGLTTYDTRAELTERPGDFLSGAFTLWHAESNFGELQNQAYGYLFPQGTWFWLTDVLGVEGWVSQRLWSALILVVACEGARRVALAIGLPGAVALLSGVVFAASPRLFGTVAVQTGESLPGAVMPWLVLAVLLHLRGVLPGWKAAVLSGAAVVCMGGVNAVETAGSLPLAIILVVWGASRGLTRWRFVAQWCGAVGLACLWWALPLLLLARYAPPFYEYVESATDTTSVVGWSEAARGDSSWIAYLLAGDQPWWPAAYHLATDPALVVIAAVVAAVGLVGLASLESSLNRPLMLAAVLGLGCLTVAHGGVAGAPVADAMRGLLDGSLQIFRNVHKIDPVVRLPLALGFGHAIWRLGTYGARRLPALAEWNRVLYLVPLLTVLALGRPFLLNDARTPGWEEIPTAWQETRAYLAEHAAAEGDAATAGRTLVVPGSRFAQHAWGWTIDEPLAILGGVPTVTRSQVPLIPGQSIRYLSALDQIIATGRATEALVDQLARAGITHVVLRRDLLRGVTGSPHPGAAAVSLARAGLERVAGFGETDEGAAEVEVFEVPERLPVLRSAALDDVLTVSGAPESVLGLDGAGLLSGRPTVLAGEDGWDEQPEAVTDADQRRERAFGINDEALSSVLTADEPWRTTRAVHDFPGVPGNPQVVARYEGLESVTASSAQGYADNFGPVSVQSGPYAAIDGDLDSRWVSSVATDPEEQWLRLTFDQPRDVHRVTVTPVADDPLVTPVRTLEVVAGDQRVEVDVNVSGAPAVVPLDGSEVESVEVRVVAAATADDSARVGLREVEVDRLEPRRTLVVPGTIPADASWQLSAVTGRRACYITLGQPDCDAARARASEEPEGLDRTFTLGGAQEVRLSGHVVVRSTPEAARLLDVVQHRPPVAASSVFGQDPKVAARFAYDGQTTTAWVSDNADPYPTLSFRWQKARRITGLTVATQGLQQVPTTAVVSTPRRSQRVTLGGAETEIRPVRTRELRVRFVKPAGARHVVVPEIGLTGVEVFRPFLPNAPTGSVCGLGPLLRIDGETIKTRVTGTLADVVNGSPMELEACRPRDDDGPITLAEGEHHLRAVPTAEFEVLDVTAVPEDAVAGSPGAGRVVEVQNWGDSTRTVRVAAGEGTLLYLPENFNEGWVAEADGERLMPVRVDGWQQGWVLPSGEATTVELRFAPQRTYDVLLPLGLGVSGAVLLAGLLVLLAPLLQVVRRRPLTAVPARDWPPLVPTRWPLRAGAVVVSLLLLGPACALALGGAVLAGDRPRWTAVAVAASGLVVLSGVLDVLGGETSRAAADLAAAVAVGVLAGRTLR
ncbi:arabinofuranan 3-O-arabinosyltransferase [Nocardioides thalensis]|uniref:Arabinofuranan 3-O-arabinosyltransferase n=1 Tax=Nocardioides thalensis TaxID=1914755 RepID=A0A853C0G6_9ACTN|nr:alpha-(1->3)-arabinofuranosyltransferase family protein [Nocardioides thalensis]NYJ01035.1 arabinofuranan 3-O-arabinosyltransferase [Nocardioides thalensis]